LDDGGQDAQMSDATTLFIDKLSEHGSKVQQRNSNVWIAQCPAHDDKQSSLSVGRGRGGVILKCFAGCEYGDILREVGLTENDGFDDKKEIRYDYRHHGKLVRTVHRQAGKRFRQEVIDATVVPLYVPEGQPTDFTNKTVWIPEGEKDVDFLTLHGVTAVTSPGGAAAWAKADYTPLKVAKNVVIISDNDEPGLKRALELRELVASYGVMVDVVKPADGLKDATDHLLKGFSLSQFQFLEFEEPVDPFEEAVADQVSKLLIQDEAKKRAREMIAVLEPVRLETKTLNDLLNIQVKYDWVVENLLERRDRLIVTGMEGSGKSVLLRQMSLCIASGVHPFEPTRQVEPRRVLVIDAENTEQQWARGARQIVSALERQGKTVARDAVNVQAGLRLDLTRQHDLNEVHRLIDTHKPDLIYLGPLYKLVPKEITTDDDAAPLLVALDGIRERGVVLLMEAHAGHAKGHGGERDLRPRGSSALLGWPEFGYGLRPDYESEIAEFKAWRGDREVRDWPRFLRIGNPISGELPWVKTVNL
jgi:replicative DNA helicase